MSILYMMVGIPGSGKSTWIKKFLEHVPPEIPYVVISTDDYIEQKAKEEGKTYSEVFNKYIGAATTNAYERAKVAIASEINVIWDQTNLTRKSRAKKLALFPKSYSKYWCYHPVPDDEELDRRLNSRPGKHISKKLIENMLSTFEMPTIDEGFNGYVL